jgi:hypothetical protein
VYGSWSDCENYPYDKWAFVAPSDGFAYLSVDTLSSKTTFDPEVAVFDSKGCWLAWSVDPSFTCTYPPASGDCASLSLPVTKGEVYYAMVNVDGSCTSSDAEYKLSFDVPADPGAKLVVTDETYWSFERRTAQGTFHIP